MGGGEDSLFFKAHISNLFSFGKYFMTIFMCVRDLLSLLRRCCNKFAFPEPTLVNDRNSKD